ncbi:MAG: sigma-54 dependent transcriptional regulator [Bacteroidota bacterium]
MVPFKPISIITQNSEMRSIIAQLDRIVDTNSSILLIGETGVGKEIFAEYIHRTSNRSQNTFIKIGLAALPSDLMASELFGHEKGAFTGAISSKKGMFELANHGSIFLDDIDDIPLDIQIKLLRVLESREIMRVGGTKTIPVDIRLISATKVDLKELVKNKLFRQDLLYRINIVPIRIPPLRERKDDIELLTNYFLEKYSNHKTIGISPETINVMIKYDWPGNVRELRNIIQRASLFAENSITINDLPLEIANTDPMNQMIKVCSACLFEKKVPFKTVINCLEINLINEALSKTGGNQSEAARILNLSLSTLRDKIKKHEIKTEDCKWN